MIQRHLELTGSRRAHALLGDWAASVRAFSSLRAKAHAGLPDSDTLVRAHLSALRRPFGRRGVEPTLDASEGVGSFQQTGSP
jgi:hypothetical protein